MLLTQRGPRCGFRFGCHSLEGGGVVGVGVGLVVVLCGSGGGSGGGGTQLTEYGKQKITDFEAMKQRCWEFIDQQNKEFNNL